MENEHEKREMTEFENTVRSMISREDDLINHRMGWMSAFNGLLFAALGFSWQKPGAGPVIFIFCMLGLLVSIMNAVALGSAVAAQRRLLLWWRDTMPRDYRGPGVIGIYPNPINSRHMTCLFLSSWVPLAVAFFIVWLSVLIYIWK